MSRRRQFGSARLRASGRWEARYIVDGQQHRAARTFASKTEAALFLDTMRVQITNGTWLDPRVSGETLESYARAWIAQRQGPRGRPLAVRTSQTYRNSLNLHIAPTIGHLPLSKVTPAIVRTWHSDLVATGKLTAARQSYALLRAVMNTAVIDGAVPRNPCQIKGAGQPDSPERPLLGLDDVTALSTAMPDHLRCLVYVTFWAALRLGEVVALRRGDVDLHAGVLRVQRQQVELDGRPQETLPKTGRTRIVVLPPRSPRPSLGISQSPQGRACRAADCSPVPMAVPCEPTTCRTPGRPRAKPLVYPACISTTSGTPG